MSFSSTSALVAIADGNGLAVNQAAGNVQQVTAGNPLTFTLQAVTANGSASGIIQCILVVGSNDDSISGTYRMTLDYSNPNDPNAIVMPMPAYGYTAWYTMTAYGPGGVTATAGGTLVGSPSATATTSSTSTSRAYSTPLLAPFAMPASGSTVAVNFATAGFQASQSVWINGTGAQMIIQSITDGFHAVLQNPPTAGYIVNNPAAGTQINGTTVYALAPVGKRGNIAGNIASNSSGFMCRLVDIAKDNIPFLRCAWPGWAASSGVETNITGTISITATIEYPLGTTVTRLKFNGSNTGTIAAGQTLFSDMLTLPATIPLGARFAIRWFWQGTSQIVYASGSHVNVPGGDCISSSAGDLTGSTGSFTDGGNGLTMAPVAVLGPTAKNTYGLLGDSRSYGLNDLTTDGANDYGEWARIIGRAHAYIQVGASGETAQSYVSGNALRTPIAQFCSVIVDSHGINDISNATTPATLQGLINTIAALFPNKLVYLSTMPPKTTSSDSFATLANQTVDANNANRVTMNGWTRTLGSVAVPVNANIVGFLDIANLAESSWNSGKWQVTGATTNDTTYTTDGLHEASFECRLFVPGGIDAQSLSNVL